MLLPFRVPANCRDVRLGDDWMLSGAQQLYAASEGPAMLRLA